MFALRRGPFTHCNIPRAAASRGSGETRGFEVAFAVATHQATPSPMPALENTKAQRKET